MKTLHRLIVIGGALTVVLIAGYFILFNRLVAPPSHPPFDRQTMEAVVAKIRAFNIPPGTSEQFMLDHLSDPESFRPWHQEGGHALLREGAIQAYVSADGKLRVLIYTANHNHGGAAGLFYSEIPVPAAPADPAKDSPLNDLDSFFTLVEKIDDHWWHVYSNND